MDRRRLPTSATRFDVRARPSSAIILVRIGSVSLSRGPASPGFAYVRLLRGEPSATSQTHSIVSANSQSPARPATGTRSGRQSGVKGSCKMQQAPLLDPLPCTTVSPTRCRERFGVSPAAPCAGAPFESNRCVACRVGLGLHSRALPRRRTRSRKPGCFPPCRRPFGYVKIAPHARSDSVSQSRRRTLR